MGEDTIQQYNSSFPYHISDVCICNETNVIDIDIHIFDTPRTMCHEVYKYSIALSPQPI